MTFLKRQIFVLLISFFLFFFPVQMTLAKTGWSNSSYSQGWQEFVPRMGKPDFDANKIVGCGGPKKSYQILFGGTQENEMCQIGVSEPYRDTQRDIDFSEYDINGTMRTKCANVLTSLPQDIYVPSPTKHAVWCPYDHPEVRNFSVINPNKFIEDLKDLASLTDNRATKSLNEIIQDAINRDPNETPWRKGFSGSYPNHATDAEPSYGRKEREIARAINEHQSVMLTAYLFADEPARRIIAEKIARILEIYSENDAFEYLFNTPFSQHIKKRDSEGGEGEMFDDYSRPGYWDNSATMGLNYFLPSIINLYSILKSERPSDPRLLEIRKYVQSLVWLNEQGLDYGVVNKDWAYNPSGANHHSASRAFIHLLWGVADSDDAFFQAGVNHFVSVIQDSRPDGSISSEVKPSPSAKSTHGGWGSIDRNNETLGFHALSATVIASQGYDLSSISIKKVNFEKNIEFGVAAFFDPSVADRWTKVKNYSSEYKDDPTETTNKNLSWYLLSSQLLGYKPNEEILQFIIDDEWQGMAQNLGLLNVRYFMPMEEPLLFSNKFDGLRCDYQIRKRGYDEKKKKNYEYVINLGEFSVQNGQVRFGSNVWKVGGISLSEDHLDRSSLLFVQDDGSIKGTFPVFTSTKKKQTKTVEINLVNQGSSLKSTAIPMGDFVAKREESYFILRVNSCN